MPFVKDVKISVQKDFILVSFYITTGQEQMLTVYTQVFTVMIVIVVINTPTGRMNILILHTLEKGCIQMSRPKHLQYILIPYSLLKEDSLSDKERIVLANILGVVQGGGSYKFDNIWIADYLNCHPNTASRTVSSLQKKGWIDVNLVKKKGTNAIAYRVLTIRDRGLYHMGDTPLYQTVKHNNNTLDNTQVNNNKKELSQRFKEFSEEVRSYAEYSQYHEAFINWWGEDNGTYMKWELEKRKKGTFAIKNRLNTFKLRDNSQGQDDWEASLREKYGT
jgi:hypothetical protein